MPAPYPVVILSSMNAVSRATVASALVCDLPNAVVIQHDLASATGGDLRRVSYDASGVVEDVSVHLDHTCLGCALREDIVPTLIRFAESGRWEHIVLALPSTAELAPVVTAISRAVVGGRPAAHRLGLAAVIATINAATLEAELLGDELLAERGQELTDDDRRGVGETLAHQIESADLVVCEDLTDDAVGDRARTLVRHLAPPTVRLCDPYRVPVRHVANGELEPALTRRLDDPWAVEPTREPDAHGVWTVDLRSWRPIHPERLVDDVELLGGGAHRSRGRFWVATRPSIACCWDGAGGQLSIGKAGGWHERPNTRIVITGAGGGGAEQRPALRAAFDRLLMTDAELARGLDYWAARSDALEPWLGPEYA